MEQLDQNKQEKIKDFIEQKESKTSLGQIEKNLEELGLDVQVGHWLKNDKKMLQYAQLYLKQDQNIFDPVKMQFLELRISVTCPYFEDFKSFLNELKKGKDTNSEADELQDTHNDGEENIDVSTNGHNFMGIQISEIKSEPFYKNPSTGVTRCAATARFNAQNFGLELPSGDAYTAGTKPGKQALETLPDSKRNQKPNANRPSLDISQFPKVDDNMNFVDLYLNSSSQYGHRAVGFKDQTGQRYILDPYTRVNGKLDNKPQKIEDYSKFRKIIKAHFYSTNGYNFESKNYA